MIAVGVAFERPELVVRGLDLLGWLLARETRDGHLSVTPAEARGPGDVGPALIKQPIEVSTMAERLRPSAQRRRFTEVARGNRHGERFGLTGTMTPKS